MGRSARRGESSDPYWVSFTDLLTALLFVFILATLAFMAQVGQKQAELSTTEAELSARIASLEQQRDAIDSEVGRISRAENVRSDVLTEVRDELADLGIHVEVNKDQSVLSIPSEQLGFASGQYTIDSRNQQRALQIGSVLHRILSEGDRADYLDTVFIEGHTDARPFNGPLGMGNWGLSTFRAISLWNLWESGLPSNESLSVMRNSAGNNLFSVSGYAHTRPADGGQIEVADVPQNRRIDIRITIVRPTSEELGSILSTEAGE